MSFVVCQHFGIDTSEYSFGYVAGWDKSKDMARLKASLGCIRDTADEMINSIEEKCMTTLTRWMIFYGQREV